MVLANHLDWFFKRYGWDLDRYMGQPRWLIQSLQHAAQAQESAAEKRSREAGAAAEAARLAASG